MKGKAVPYSSEELAWIEANAQRVRREAHADFVARFGRHDVSLCNFIALCKRRGWLTGRDGRFAKGLVPHNAGKPFPVARENPACRATQFRKGQRSGLAVKLWKPIGTERIGKGGYRLRKVNNDLPLQRRWRFVHVIEWEAVNGPLPDGMALKCLDGNRLNCDPSNWIAVPRAMLPRLAGSRVGIPYDTAPADLKPAILAAARLAHAARQRRKA